MAASAESIASPASERGINDRVSLRGGIELADVVLGIDRVDDLQRLGESAEGR